MADQTATGSTDNQGGQSGLGPVIREQASKLADRSKEAGLETADAVGKAAERAARELQDNSPELANYVRDAANYTQRLASDLRDRPASELIADAIEWGRHQPLVALAGAAVLGFALSRVVKTGWPSDGNGGDKP